jgi:hypothetical protein
MRKDFKIAILCAGSAVPLGVALMAAPDYLHIPPAYLGLCFWGGLGLTALLLGAAVVIAIKGEAGEPRIGHKRRMIALVGMIVCGIGFLGFAGAYFWPAAISARVGDVPAAPGKAAITAEYDALRDGDVSNKLLELYQSDFKNEIMYSAIEILSATDGREIKIGFRIYMNFDSNSYFLSGFVPDDHLAYNLSIRILNDYRSYASELFSRYLLVQPTPTGDGPRTSSNMTFTGALYLYTARILTEQQVSLLHSSAEAQKVLLRLRGLDYAASKGLLPTAKN